MATLDMSQAAKKPSPSSTAAIPERWSNVGSLNIDLDGLSLRGQGGKKASVPMNAMKTSSSSNESPMSPTFGAFPAVGQQAARPQQQATQQSGNALDDLLF